MELIFTPEENAFREQVREFVRREVTSQVVDRTDGLTEQYDAALHQKLAENGWIGCSGLAATAVRREVIGSW